MSTVNIHQIDYRDIDIKNPDRVSHKLTVFNIGYNGKRLIFQTPKSEINLFPFLYTTENQRYYKVVLSFYNYSIDQKTKNFIQQILNIEKQIKDGIPSLLKKINSTNIKDNFETKKNKFISSIRFNKNKNKAYLTCNIQKQYNKPVISVFDCEKNKKDYTYIEPGFKSVNLLFLENIWNYNNSFGVNFVILQTKVYQPVLEFDELLIKDDEDIDYTPVCYETYSNKSKENINQQAITNIPSGPPPAPPPPPLPISKSIASSNKQPVNTNINIINKDDKLSNTNIVTVFRPPTANELQNAISKLKKRDLG